MVIPDMHGDMHPGIIKLETFLSFHFQIGRSHAPLKWQVNILPCKISSGTCLAFCFQVWRVQERWFPRVKLTWCSAATRSCAFVLSPVVRAGREGGPQDEIDQEADKVAGGICSTVGSFSNLLSHHCHHYFFQASMSDTNFRYPRLTANIHSSSGDSRVSQCHLNLICTLTQQNAGLLKSTCVRKKAGFLTAQDRVERVEGWCNAAFYGSHISILLRLYKCIYKTLKQHERRTK